MTCPAQRFLNVRGGYTLIDAGTKRELFGAIPQYEFTLDATQPLMWQGEVAGLWGYWQPDRHGRTDLGSVPVPLQAIPGLGKDRFRAAYIFHDSACREGCLYRSAGGGLVTHRDSQGNWWASFMDNAEPFVRVPVTRAQADAMLYSMIRADRRAWLVQAATIYAGVRIGAASDVLRRGLRALRWRW